MFRILESQAPTKQTVTDTINTLSGRLLSATLLEDRRAAILGLRSFAKEYPASVASAGLRGLISSLTKDTEDVDTVKVVLETLLMLFSPNETSPEASEDIALWLADEFTQRQGNITLLLDLLDAHEFYSRLYSLQLLSAISSARPERTLECVFTAPLGITRLVAILDDRRDAIRNEGVLLLTALTTSSTELQKLVAFENAFDRIFALIESEGSLTHGGVIVEDCLSLLANLLRVNVSNQSFFRETGCVSRFTTLLSAAVKEEETGVADWARPQRDKNLWGLLAVLRLFLVRGALGTQANQASFWQNGVHQHLLHLAFQRSSEKSVKAEALLTCADLIRGNRTLQETFAQLQVASVIDEPSSSLTEPKSKQNNGIPMVYVIDGLLDLALTLASIHAFNVRLAACECIKAYVFNHAEIRLHFLRRAIDGHIKGEDETANVLSTLMDEPESIRLSDPCRLWLAAVLVFHLIFGDSEAKALLNDITEGDASSGEEVITCVQAVTSSLIAAIRRGDDEGLSVGYMLLLCGWLFEEPDAVNDLLGEGSSFQSLVQAVTQGGHDQVLMQGMCAVLLGIIYEFSTKDSPVPRVTLHSILVSVMGREQYIDVITQLNFEVLGQHSRRAEDLPNVFFDKTFVDFFRNNFSRFCGAIDRDPGLEIPVIANGIQKGISRELVDSLRSQVDEKDQALQKAESEHLNLERKLGQEQADHKRTKEVDAVELNRVKNINGALQRNHEEELAKFNAEHQATVDRSEEQHQAEIERLRQRMQQLTSHHNDDIIRITAEHQAAMDRNQKLHQTEVEGLRDQLQQLGKEIDDLKGTIRMLEANVEKSNKEHMQDLYTAHEESSARLSAAEEARKSVQTELDDMLMVLSDLEEKRTRDKVGKSYEPPARWALANVA
ncbi:MAG: hypothetical protein M1836_005923 [Candelina mexicana]|nr:MAG: hypothetical protein M1836_005923 [Candelina mexicana]